MIKHMEEDPEYPDLEGLGYHLFSDGSCIGYVERVNGGECRACFEFDATRHELKVVAKYWYRELTKLDLDWFFHHTTGSTQWRTAAYAWRRIQRIRHMIGDELVDEVIAEVDRYYCQQVGKAEWERFNANR